MVTWKDFVKKAQWELVSPPVHAYAAFMPDSEYKRQLMKQDQPGTDIELTERLGKADMSTGFLKGVREAVPGMIDFFIGNGAGIVNGLGGMAFGRPFHKGFKESKDFATKYYSDPLRKIPMALGGNALRKAYHQQRASILSQLRKNSSPEEVAQVDRWSRNLGTATEIEGSLLAAFPLYSSMAAAGATPGSMAASRLQNFAQARNMSRLLPWTSRIGTFLDTTPIFGPGAAEVSKGLEEKNNASDDLKKETGMGYDDGIAEAKRLWLSGAGTPEERAAFLRDFPEAAEWK